MIQIEPLEQKHLEDASRLFVHSYRAQRANLPCLPDRYEDPAVAERLLAEVLPAHPGVAALERGQLVGYLAGFAHIPHFHGTHPGVYIPEWAHTMDSRYAPADLFQPMYTELARQWVDAGCVNHAITFWASHHALRDLLYWNGFGLLVVDAVRAIDANGASVDVPREASNPPTSVIIRPAAADDLAGLARLDDALTRYLARSPIFRYAQESAEPDAAAEFLDPSAISVVATEGRRLLACMRGTLQKEDSCTIVRDNSVMGINIAYTEPGARGRGMGAQLLQSVLSWGRAQQKSACTVDFEAANSLARTFWLRHFTPVCYTAIRHADARVRAPA
jgi:GNAT superfamily N-acetyltransferase